ncbi:MAG TPA: lysylphosphatidylglycerol synthase transmembrane domain-containing protein [Steroidobacteraceae bacterium]
MTTRRLALRCGQVVLSLGLLTYLVATIPMHDVLATLQSARTTWFVGGFAIVGATTLLAALQMRAILATQGMPFSVWQVAGINLITNFYGLFLPSSLAGGVIRWHHFSTPEGKRAQALAAIIFSRGVEVVTMLGYGIVFWYFANSKVSSASAVAAMIVTLTAVVFIVLLSVSQAPHAMLRAALTRLPLARHILERILRVSTCLVDFGRCGRRHQLRILLLCIVRNAFAVAAFICFARALNIAVPAVDLGWVRAVVDLVLIIPISIAGLGVRDASLVAMLSPLGVPSAVALALSFLLLAVSLFVALLGGLVEGWRIYNGIAPGLAKPQVYEDIDGP